MALTNLFYSDSTVDVHVSWNGGLTTATVSHYLTGLTARAHAKHYKDDVYSQAVGSDLAIARAKARLYTKVQKRIANNPILTSIEEVI